MTYKIVFAFIKLLSRMPFWCLYIISDIFYLLLYYVVKYRRKVILSNLAITFPSNTLIENKIIARKFTRHFADVLLETFKLTSLSPEKAKKIFHYSNPELIEEELKKQKNIMILPGHMGNWESIFAFALYTEVKNFAAYAPLSNSFFNRMMKSNRERFGCKAVSAALISDEIKTNVEQKIQFINFLVADQSPPSNYSFRSRFFGQDVPFFFGPEAYAIKYNQSVFFAHTRKTKRSRYIINFIPITSESQKNSPQWITNEYIRLLEVAISENPEHYLWSHRRFKHASS